MNHVCMDHITDQSDAAISMILLHNTEKETGKPTGLFLLCMLCNYSLVFCIVLRNLCCSGRYFLLLYVGRCLLVAGKFIGIIPLPPVMERRSVQ